MSLATLFVLCRFIHFASLMQLFGSLVFIRLLPPKTFSQLLVAKNQRLVAISVWAMAITAIAMLAIQAGMMGNGWQDSINLNVWLLVLTTTFGEVWRWHMLLAVFTVLLLLNQWLPGREIGVLLLVTLSLISQALIGHAAMNEGMLGWVQRSNHALHLLSASYWFGSLLPLLTCLLYTKKPALRQDAIATLLRFSTYGHLAVVVVIVTGIVNSLIILRNVPISLHVEYQLLLACKIVVVAIMVGVAIFNRYKLVPMMANNRQVAEGRMVRATWLMFSLSLLVLALISLLATLSPGQ
ncbi:copper homeostasis membrane protein CopD [Rouxiella sp. Mn2063]|uniref:copper homeostasis membrane protein CopD n=1 Tax=Rouxiella sp. Mn2063 TaxID=3395262 RepID=UPI003BCD2802